MKTTTTKPPIVWFPGDPDCGEALGIFELATKICVWLSFATNPVPFNIIFSKGKLDFLEWRGFHKGLNKVMNNNALHSYFLQQKDSYSVNVKTTMKRKITESEKKLHLLVYVLHTLGFEQHNIAIMLIAKAEYLVKGDLGGSSRMDTFQLIAFLLSIFNVASIMVSNVNNNNNNNNINDNDDNVNDNNINESNTNAEVNSMSNVGLGGKKRKKRNYESFNSLVDEGKEFKDRRQNKSFNK